MKPDKPRKSKEGGKPIKYESPIRTANRAYFPPGTRVALSDASLPLIVTEGEKKSAKADQEGFACIGLVGVDGWSKKRPKNAAGKGEGPRELIPDLASIAWLGRIVFIAYDSDLAEKPQLRWAEWHLAEVLQKAGAKVFALRIPPASDGAKQGLDDYLVAAGVEALRGLLSTAKPVEKPESIVPEIIIDVDEHRVNAAACRALVGEQDIYQRGGATPHLWNSPLLGISGAAVRAAVKRLGLTATGNGKARTFPRSTVEALVIRAGQGRGPETINHYVRAVRGFFRWLVKAKRLGSNPLESLTLVNTSTDVRRTRRELTADELRRLFTAARDSERSYRGLVGADRFHVYLVAAGTGFRASALASLTPTDFDLNDDSPIVTLAARFNKSRKLKVQPLPLDVAEALRDYLKGKPSNAPVWGGTWARDHRGAEMLRFDLNAAGIPYAVEGPDGLEYADFHSLRHSFLTLGGRSGIDLRTLQVLAGHSKPELTARYSHRRLYDLTGAVAKLPNLVPTNAAAAEIPLRMTGTEGAKSVVPGVVGEVPGVVKGGFGGINRHRLAFFALWEVWRAVR